jgi:hypothetical protein
MGLFSFLNFWEKDTEKEAMQLKVATGAQKYRDEVIRIIGNASLVTSNSLNFIKTEYCLNDKICKDIAFREFMIYVETVIKKNRINSEEFAEVMALMRCFGIEFSEYIEKGVKIYDKYTIWLIEETGFMPVYDGDVDIPLKRGEEVHYVARANLLNQKVRTDYIRYSGFTTSIKICNGLTYRSGTIDLQPNKVDYVDIVDEGMFYITNLRTLFVGRKGNFSYLNKSLLSIEYTAYGIAIQKENSTNPQIIQLNDYELPLVMLNHILNN